jgi:serine phosphatase RsbU (regulator of sigma subunit)
LHELLLDRDAFQEPGAIIERILSAIHTHAGGHAPDDDGTVLVLGKG